MLLFRSVAFDIQSVVNVTIDQLCLKFKQLLVSFNQWYIDDSLDQLRLCLIFDQLCKLLNQLCMLPFPCFRSVVFDIRSVLYFIQSVVYVTFSISCV